jgi:hypothetical protein
MYASFLGISEALHLTSCWGSGILPNPQKLLDKAKLGGGFGPPEIRPLRISETLQSLKKGI